MFRVIQGGVPEGERPIVWNRMPGQRVALVIMDTPHPWEPVVAAWDDGRSTLCGIRAFRLPVDAAALDAWRASALADGLPIRDERDPFNVAHEANRAGLRRAELARAIAAKAACRDHQPMPAGSLFDEVTRGQRDLF